MTKQGLERLRQLVTRPISGDGVSNSDSSVTIVPTQPIEYPPAPELTRRLMVKEIERDYLVCVEVGTDIEDEDDEEEEDDDDHVIHVALPDALQQTPFEGTEPINGYTYVFDDDDDAMHTRVSTKVEDSTEEPQVIIPAYYIGCTIKARGPIITPVVITPDNFCRWQDTNEDARAWAIDDEAE